MAIVPASLEFRSRHGCLGWNRKNAQRMVMPTDRLFDANSFGALQARWADHAGAYLQLIQAETTLEELSHCRGFWGISAHAANSDRLENRSMSCRLRQ